MLNCAMLVLLDCSTTVFSHSQNVVVCGNCQTMLCQPTGGRACLTKGCFFRKKGDFGVELGESSQLGTTSIHIN